MKLSDDLRRSVLQVAIQGKLTEQHPEDGNAEDLLKQIRTEKKKLIAEGKIKKEKPLLPISDDEKPFDIPDNWVWVRLGDIGRWQAGSTPPKTNSEFYGGKIPWLITGDLNDGFINEQDIKNRITEKALDETSVKMNPKGSVLIAMYGATIGKTAILNIQATTNQACCACLPMHGIFNKYLSFVLQALKQTFINMGEGGAQPNISKKKIITTLFPLPPLAEQNRIVERVEEIMKKIDELNKAETELEALKKKFPGDMRDALLQAAIQGKLTEQRPEDGNAEDLLKQIRAEKKKLITEGKINKEKPLPPITDDEKPFDIPDNWAWVRLGEIVAKNIKRGKSPKYTSHSKTLVFAQKCNTKKGFIDLSLAQYLDETILSKYPQEEFMLDEDIILNSTGKGTLGRVGKYRNVDNISELQLVPDSHVTIIRPLKNISNDYIYYTLKYYQPYIETLGEGSTNQTELSSGVIKMLIFPLPPLAEQNRIVERLNELLPLCEAMKGE